LARPGRIPEERTSRSGEKVNSSLASRASGQFIGRGGLKSHQIDGREVIGLAYTVMPDYWNRGFATEIAQASLDVGFGHLGFPEIDSWTLPVNLASRRVMEKLGFRYERDFEFAGLPHRFYRLAKGDWERYHGREKSS
jgi:RimJ/RimL family protein N-acetyltransferase